MKKKFPIKIVLSMAAVFFSFLFNPVLGRVVLGVFVVYMFFSNRSIFYEVFATKAHNKGEMEKAIGLFKKASKTTQNTRPKITYGYLLLKAGKIDIASEVFKEMIGSNIDEDSKRKAKSNYALVLWKDGKIDEAIELLEEVFSEYESSVIYGSLGYLYILKGDLKKALEFNKEAYDYDDADPIILDNLGYVYYLIEDFSKSDEIYKELMKLKPQFPEAYYNYSLVLKKLDKLEDALEIIKKGNNYNVSFLSNLTKEEMKSQLEEIEHLISKQQ
ncbi:hypothetical protein RBH29_05790 [Herbivorax sp. ANBcel31]|uniref:tetratricopeptide repeat protein n=1 Tax=Herbivorax sp. ANBcel31 TaxID=3069754 RepID=UPI0027AF931D|nr:tetratricopeptide repeat protein [Herbivorax sp. ANBcel31]MDQ2085950.1 hypothetical protein [Herbivorax sp. ANBcel31]